MSDTTAIGAGSFAGQLVDDSTLLLRYTYAGDANIDGTVNACGLYDLDRKPRAVEGAYRQLLQSFGRIAIVPHGELFEISGRPAMLKTEV